MSFFESIQNLGNFSFGVSIPYILFGQAFEHRLISECMAYPYILPTEVPLGGNEAMAMYVPYHIGMRYEAPFHGTIVDNSFLDELIRTALIQANNKVNYQVTTYHGLTGKEAPSFETVTRQLMETPLNLRSEGNGGWCDQSNINKFSLVGKGHPGGHGHPYHEGYLSGFRGFHNKHPFFKYFHLATHMRDFFEELSLVIEKYDDFTVQFAGFNYAGSDGKFGNRCYSFDLPKDHPILGRTLYLSPMEGPFEYVNGELQNTISPEAMDLILRIKLFFYYSSKFKYQGGDHYSRAVKDLISLLSTYFIPMEAEPPLFAKKKYGFFLDPSTAGYFNLSGGFFVFVAGLGVFFTYLEMTKAPYDITLMNDEIFEVDETALTGNQASYDQPIIQPRFMQEKPSLFGDWFEGDNVHPMRQRPDFLNLRPGTHYDIPNTLNYIKVLNRHVPLYSQFRGEPNRLFIKKQQKTVTRPFRTIYFSRWIIKNYPQTYRAKVAVSYLKLNGRFEDLYTFPGHITNDVTYNYYRSKLMQGSEAQDELIEHQIRLVDDDPTYDDWLTAADSEDDTTIFLVTRLTGYLCDRYRSH